MRLHLDEQLAVLPMPPPGGSGEGKERFNVAGEVLMQAAVGWREEVRVLDCLENLWMDLI